MTRRHPPRLPAPIAFALAVAVAVGLATVMASASPAAAQGATGRDGSIARGGNAPVIAVRNGPAPTESSAPRSRAPGGRPCVYYTFPGGRGNLPYLIPGETYRAVCRAYNGLPALTRIGPAVFNPSAGLPAPMERARKELELRVPPPQTSPASRALVGIPTWFWLPNPAVPLRQTVQLGVAPDIISATISATPTELEIEPGDGSVLRCQVDAPSRLAANRAVSEPCTHAFARASRFNPAQTKPRFKVTWALRWETNRQRPDGSFPGGPLPDGVSVGEFDLDVVEVQAINSDG